MRYLAVAYQLDAEAVRRRHSVIRYHERNRTVGNREIARYELIPQMVLEIIEYRYSVFGKKGGIVGERIGFELRFGKVDRLPLLEKIGVAVLDIIVFYRKTRKSVSRALFEDAEHIYSLYPRVAPGHFAVRKRVLRLVKQLRIRGIVEGYHSPFVVVSHKEIVVYSEVVFLIFGYQTQ